MAPKLNGPNSNAFKYRWIIFNVLTAMKLEPKVAKSTLNTTIYHSKLKALFDKLDIQQENEPSVLSIISNEIKLDEMYNVPINPH